MALAALPILLDVARGHGAPRRSAGNAASSGCFVTLVGLDYQDASATEYRQDDRKVIFAIKHQSAWDTVTTHLLIDDPAIALKQELTKIPIFGPCLLHAGMIKIDRGHGTKALRSLIEGAREAIEPWIAGGDLSGRHTHGAPEKKGTYHPGIAALYQAAGAARGACSAQFRTFLGAAKLREDDRAPSWSSFWSRSGPASIARRSWPNWSSAIETATDRLITEAEGQAAGAKEPVA